MKGYKMPKRTEEHKQNLSIALKGKKRLSMIGNQNGFKKGQNPWNKGVEMWKNREHPKGMLGKHQSEKAKQKIKKNHAHLSKDKHPRWKGNKIKYSAIHKWLKLKLGKANKCENKKCLKKSKTFDRALIKGKKYKRNEKNFWQLCRSC